MMGRRKRDQGKLFYEFRLEDRIPANHLLRRMNVFATVALADLHKELEPHYSDIGRPSVDPELMIRMLIVGYCYGLNYLIDIENAVIVDVEATPARAYDEVEATKTMLDRTEARFDLKPKRLAADTAYGTGRFLGWLVKDKKITPHIPVRDKSDRDDGIFSRSDFVWDKRRGHYVCPNGKLLRTSGTVHDGRTLLYRASKRDCDVCPLRAKCCTRDESRKLPRDLHEDARDVARRKMKTKAFLKSRDERKKVEMRFGHLKTHHGFERLRLRGLSRARDEFHLAAIVQNLKTMALRLIRPPLQTQWA